MACSRERVGGGEGLVMRGNQDKRLEDVLSVFMLLECTTLDKLHIAVFFLDC